MKRNRSLDKVPKFSEFLYPILQALKALGGSGTIDEIVEKVVELEHISPEVQQVLHSDQKQPAFSYRMAWARTYLKRVGAVLNSSRGVWTLTEKGGQLTARDCSVIPAQVRKEKYEQRKLKNAKGGNKENGNEELDEEEVEGEWKDTLLAVLLKLKPAAFERLAQRLLREAGFVKVEVTGKSGDGGIDGIGILRVNLVSFTILFQCKRFKDSVGPSVVRDFRGAMQGRCDKGLIITTGTFTAEAKKEATRDGAPAIDLIDGDSLCDLLKQLRLGVEVEQVEAVSVDEKWFDAI